MSRQQPREENGVPWCVESCQCHDGKRCELLGRRPGPICEPAVVALSLRAAKLELAAHRVEKVLDDHGLLDHKQGPSCEPEIVALRRKVEKLELAARRVEEALDIHGSLIRMPSHVALALVNLQNAAKSETPSELPTKTLEQKFTDTLARECDRLLADLEQVRRERNFVAAADDAFWVWSDTDPNGLDSLVDDALVKMTAGQLRKLLAQEHLP